MPLTLYYAPHSSASPILWALAELGLDYDGVAVDLSKGESKQPAILAHNPMGQVPTLVDGEQGMFESTAILIYLGEKYGVERGLWPTVGSPEHMVALTWMNWFGVTLGASLRLIMLNTEQWWPEELRHAGQAQKGRERLAELMAILDAQLRDNEYVAGPRFTLVDTLAAASLGWGTRVVGFDLATTPHVAAWLQRCMSRDATAAIK